MDKLIDQLYYMVQETTPLTYRTDPEYKRLSDETDRLWAEIAADLGQGGNARLNALANAQAEEERPWRLSVFRRTLALGITLGRLGV